MTLLLLAAGLAASACASTNASTQGRLRSGQWQVHLPSTHNPIQDVVQSSSQASTRTTSLTDLDAVVSETSAKRPSDAK